LAGDVPRGGERLCGLKAVLTLHKPPGG
jgi:hypothetical protein